MQYRNVLRSLACFAVFITSLLDVHAFQASIILPSLGDTSPVGVKIMALEDQERLDPFTNNTRHREVMLSLFYPAKLETFGLQNQRPIAKILDAALMPYMPPATAAIYEAAFAEYGLPSGTLSRIFTRCCLAAPMSTQTALPLLIFSPGGGESRFLYTTIMEELARRGYIVAAIDHPYDALVVEFPNGRLVHAQGKKIDRDLVELLVDTRAKDVSFVLDYLYSDPKDFPLAINTSQVIAFGHSLGGATAAEAILNDTRINGGINLDGRLFGSMEKPNVTLSKPFLQFRSEFSASKPYWHWDQAWQHLSGWKVELSLNGSRHSTFSDLPLLAEVTGLKKKLGKEYGPLLGKIDGLRVLEIVVTYVDAFAKYVSTRKRGTLLDSDANKRFPEVKIMRHG